MVPPRPSPETAGLAEAHLVDRLCSEFEARLHEGAEPGIEQILARVAPETRGPLLYELLGVEFEWRREHGERIVVEVWQRRFPGHESVVARAAEVIDESRFDAWLDSTARRTGAAARLPTDAAQPRAAEADPDTALPVHTGRAALPDRFTIRKVLGSGGFATVVLAADTKLGRLVAVKCLRADRALDEGARTMLRREAHVAAGLAHPGIVAILEVVEDRDGLLVVEEYLAGGDLRARIVPGGLPVRQVVEWMIPVAEAVAFAHQHDLFHRDLKPANILLDDRGQPRVADFGLALRDEDRAGRSPAHRCGTVAYMSPEQVRGDVNRIDGRSDTWSLGVVLYELLTGRRPFQGTREQVIDQIRTRAPRPPRELRPEIPDELERVCLRCLARRPADRYSSAADLAADLARWLADNASAAAPAARSRVVPKGLRAFGPRDHDFFLDLLPGPRDADGLPEVIRFWKAFVERQGVAAVGVIHGPSGCGKSSLARSGLLPRCSADVLPVVIDAGADDTPRRLLAALRLRVPGLEGAAGLVDAVAAVRAGRAGGHGRRVLLVLDQFEQWLSGWNPTEPSELVDCLRQCDGERVRALVLVRDDFWPALLRLFERLGIALDSRENARGVDLFDIDHARRVLTLFGQAQGSLPPDAAAIDADGRAFVEAAVEVLADRGRVICVRLALFAELLKHRPWATATLDGTGNAERLGVAFLEESLDPSCAPVERRRHADGARRILRSLLPAAGSPIRGVVRSAEVLREIGGYGNDPRGFDEAMHWLDGELRLVTPVVDIPAAEPTAESGATAGKVVGYQLTHDFLIPSLRHWLLRADLSTPRGRTRHFLAERAALWATHPADRLLPGPWEHLRILRHTRPYERSAVETRYLRRAAAVHRRHGLAGAALAIGLALAAWVGHAALDHSRRAAEAHAGLRRLEAAHADQWEPLLGELSAPRLATSVARALGESESADAPPVQIRLLRLTMLGDRMQLPAIHEALLSAKPDAVAALRSTLLRCGGLPSLEPLWDAALPVAADGAEPEDDARAFRAAVALAGAAADDPRFVELAPRIVRTLAAMGAREAIEWRALLEPVRRFLVPELLALFRSTAPDSAERRFALEALVDAARDDGRTIAAALLDSDPASFAPLVTVARARLPEVVGALQGALAEPDGLAAEWNDPPPPPEWTAPATIAAELAAASGGLHPGFAFCLAAPVDRLAALCSALEPGGYRPVFLASARRRNGGNGSAQVIWQRDGLAGKLLDAVPIDRALDEDSRQARLGHEVIGWFHTAPDRVTVAWGAPRIWGSDRRWTVGPRGRLERGVDDTIPDEPVRYSAGPWHVRYAPFDPGSSPDTAPAAGAEPRLAPLLEGDFPDLRLATAALRRSAAALPRDVVAVAERSIDTAEAMELELGVMYVEGCRLSVDGIGLDGHDRPRGATVDSLSIPVALSAGRHTLSVELQWTQLDPRTFVTVGRPTLGCTTLHDSQTPDWMLDAIGPVRPEAPTVVTETAFDVRRVAWQRGADRIAIDAAIAARFRPFRVTPLDAGGRMAIDFCRPRPTATSVDRQAARQARALVALVELDGDGSAADAALDAALRPRRHPLDHDRLDAGLVTEVTLALADYPLAEPPWERLHPAAAPRFAPGVRQALWLALGRAGTRFSAETRGAWTRRLDILGQWKSDRDAGVHGALDWLVRQWKLDTTDFRPAPSSEPVVPDVGARPTSWLDSSGRPYAVFAAGPFHAGGLDPAAVFVENTPWRAATIDRPFALAATCVTLAEYHRFEQARLAVTRDWPRTSAHPRKVSWIEAIQYLNWCSDEAGLERCYEFDAAGNVVIPVDSLERDGYRLPTAAEWERAARAGTGTDWIHGSTPARLGAYAWTDENRDAAASQPVGLKAPNPAGLFDMHGNEQEWVHDGDLPGLTAPGAVSNAAGGETVTTTTLRQLRSRGIVSDAGDQRVHLSRVVPAATASGAIRITRTLGTPGRDRRPSPHP